MLPGVFKVKAIPLTITAKPASKEYGEEKVFEGGPEEFEVAGDLKNGDQVTMVTITSEEALNASTPVGEYEEKIVPGFPIEGINTNNYDIVFSNGTLTVTQAVLKITVNNATWKVGKPRPSYSFADFSSQLKGNDTMADITGGTGVASDVVYTNKVWQDSEPAADAEELYEDEIWIDVSSLDGTRVPNYVIEIEPGDLTVRAVEPEIEVTNMSATLNWNTGLLDLEITVQNTGDGEVDPDYNYWVELKPGPAENGPKASVEKSYYIDSPTGTMPDGFDYVDLTAKVKAALKAVGNRDEVFDPGEKVTVKCCSIYHWKRWKVEKFITDPNSFFVWGLLFNEADTNKDFVVSEAEKTAASSLLGSSSAAYLEVTRLAELPYYHWKVSEGTWK